jgi:hypothetical protein
MRMIAKLNETDIKNAISLYLMKEVSAQFPNGGSITLSFEEHDDGRDRRV